MKVQDNGISMANKPCDYNGPAWDRPLHFTYSGNRAYADGWERCFGKRPVPQPVKRRITRNAAECLRCGDIIESKYRWDYVSCTCGAIAVDGGHDYLRRCGELDSYHDLSEYDPPVCQDRPGPDDKPRKPGERKAMTAPGMVVGTDGIQAGNRECNPLDGGSPTNRGEDAVQKRKAKKVHARKAPRDRKAMGR
jgi:hypothetical protein